MIPSVGNQRFQLAGQETLHAIERVGRDQRREIADCIYAEALDDNPAGIQWVSDAGQLPVIMALSYMATYIQ